MAASLTYVSSTSNSATLKYSVSGYSLPSNKDKTEWAGDEPSTGSTWNQTKVTIEYQNLSYSWSFGETKANGSHTFTGLSAGVANKISGTVTIRCQTREVRYIRKKTREWIEGTPAEGDKPAVPGKWGSWSGWSSPEVNKTGNWSNYTIDTEGPISKTVYTKPSTFIWSGTIQKNNTIELNLSASDWNLLCDKAAQKINWEHQSSNANTSVAKVSSKEIISANKYNLLAGYLGVSKVSKGDLIMASLFIALSTAVNT